MSKTIRKVWLVTMLDRDLAYIIGIFSSLDKATSAKAKYFQLHNIQPIIERIELNKHLLEE